MALTDVYRNVLDGPPIAPPRYSLLTALPTVDDATSRWQGGYTYTSELSGAHGAGTLEDCYQVWTGGQPLVWPESVDPIVVWAQHYCRTTFGGLPRDWEGQLRRALLAHQSYDIARALADQLTPAATDQASGAAAPPVALQWVEDKLADLLGGVVGTIWCSPGTLAVLAGAGLVRLDGARWVTPIGTVVAADAGFAPGAGVLIGPDPGWLVGTGPARVWLSPIAVPSADEARGLIDTSTNSVTLIAERMAAVEIDYLFESPGGGAQPDPDDRFAVAARLDAAASGGGIN